MFFPLRELQVLAPSRAAGFKVVPAQRKDTEKGLAEREAVGWG